jgi:hypothetical protein
MPLHNYNEKRIKTHLFIYMLSYYVLWYIKECWKPLIFPEEEADTEGDIDSIAHETPLDTIKNDVLHEKLTNNYGLMNFNALFNMFKHIKSSKHELKLSNIPEISYKVVTEMNAHQAKAYELLKTIKV